MSHACDAAWAEFIRDQREKMRVEFRSMACFSRKPASAGEPVDLRSFSNIIFPFVPVCFGKLRPADPMSFPSGLLGLLEAKHV